MSVLLDRPDPRPVEPVLAHVVTAGACAVVLGLVLSEIGYRAGPAAIVAVVLAAGIASLIWQRHDVAMLGLVLTLPLGGVDVGPVELVQATVGAVAVIVVVKAALRVSLELPAWQIGVPLGVFAVIAGLATTRTREPDLAFRLDLQLGLLLLLVVAMVTGLTTHAAVRRVTLGLVAAGGAVAAFALVTSGPTTSYYAGGVVEGRAQGIFGQPNELGVFAAALLVLAVGAALASTSRRARVLCLGSAALLLVALGLSLSRGAWVGALVGLAALFVLSPPARRPLAKAAAASLAFLTLLVLAGTGFTTLLVERLSSLGEATSNPYDQRPQIWAEAFRQIGENPGLGLGPGGFTDEAQSSSLSAGLSLNVEHAHSLFLNTAVEFGVPGLVALLGLMAGLLFSAVRARSALEASGAGAEAGIPSALAAALVAVAVHGLLDYPMRNAVCITTVFLLIALLAASRRRSVRRTVVAAGDFRPLPARPHHPRTGTSRARTPLRALQELDP